MTDRLGEALADLEGRDYLVPHDIEHAYGSWLDVVAAARSWHALTNPTDEMVERCAHAVWQVMLDDDTKSSERIAGAVLDALRKGEV